MLEQLLQLITNFVIFLIQTTSYFGIAILMGLQSANIPIPSEVILPFAGFLASQGALNTTLIVTFAVVGALIGGSISFIIGKFLYPWIEILTGGIGQVIVSLEELALAKRWFEKWGDWTVLVGTMLPLVRTYISLASGASGIKFKRFLIYSLVGNLIWSSLLTYLGYNLGQHWDTLGPTFRQFDYLILILVIIGLAWLIWHRARRLRG